MKKAVFGLANNESHADRIVNRLQQNGFSFEDISVLYADREGKMQRSETVESSDFTRESSISEERQFKNPKKGTLGTEKHTKAPEGGVTGATAGGIIGGSLGLLAGIGSLAIPGLGVFIAAGPILAALSGSAVGGALGLLIGSLVGMGIPEYEAKKYETALESGHVLLCVQAMNSDMVEKAKDILKKEGAKDISTSSEKAGSRDR